MAIRGPRPESWTRAALESPRACGAAPLPKVQIKVEPEDFRVEELLSFTPSEAGPHWLLRIEKRAANTPWVAAELARIAGLPLADIGYAGLKDRHAIAVQWFSVPVRAQQPVEFWSKAGSEEFKVLEVRANARKLKRGALAGNQFHIRLRRLVWPPEDLDTRIAALRAHGAPNYFGAQRFGREGFNLDRLAGWVASGREPRGRAERGFALSAARALIFNAVLARRVQAGNWSRLEEGDLASLEGSGSYFHVAAIDDELERRLAAFDIHPSGPLWGRGVPQTSGRALDTELEVAREFGAVAELLAMQGLAQERRALRCRIRDLSVEADGSTLTLSFALGRGQFATAVLRELCEFEQPLFEPAAD